MKYLKDIKGVLKALVPFSNFPYGEIKKRFSQKRDKISLEDIDELKDLFIEFCDEFGFEIEELDDELFMDLIDDRSFIYNLVRHGGSNLLTYIRKILGSDKYGNYVFFSLSISKDYSMDQLKGIVNLTDDIYNRILYMGYNCDVSLYTMGYNSNQLFLVFRIGYQLKSVNSLKDGKVHR